MRPTVSLLRQRPLALYLAASLAAGPAFSIRAEFIAPQTDPHCFSATAGAALRLQALAGRPLMQRLPRGRFLVGLRHSAEMERRWRGETWIADGEFKELQSWFQTQSKTQQRRFAELTGLQVVRVFELMRRTRQTIIRREFELFMAAKKSLLKEMAETPRSAAWVRLHELRLALNPAFPWRWITPAPSGPFDIPLPGTMADWLQEILQLRQETPIHLSDIELHDIDRLANDLALDLLQLLMTNQQENGVHKLANAESQTLHRLRVNETFSIQALKRLIEAVRSRQHPLDTYYLSVAGRFKGGETGLHPEIGDPPLPAFQDFQRQALGRLRDLLRTRRDELDPQQRVSFMKEWSTYLYNPVRINPAKLAHIAAKLRLPIKETVEQIWESGDLIRIRFTPSAA